MMTKEELEKEAREYLAEHSEYSEVFGQTFVAVDTLTAMLDFAEPREKQIEIDAKQIIALQQQKGELIDKVKELESKIKHLTKHLEPQAMSALFEQVEEEVNQEQRIKELEA